MIFRTLLALATVLPALSAVALADPLSRTFNFDFYRDVPSRNLKGLAARSDGRLLAGPVLTPLRGELAADLLWTLERVTPEQWLIGTGPDGRVLEVTLDPVEPQFTARTFAKLDETQILALHRLADGRVLAGTSPTGRLYLLASDGSVVAQVALPVDSILDLVRLDDTTVLAATGNPGRIYRVNLASLAGAGSSPDKITDPTQLAAKGVSLLTEIRDSNVRRLVVAGDRLVFGSAPRGSVYTLPRTAPDGSSAVFLQENREAEVTDLLPLPNGDVYAAIVYGGTTAEARVARPAPATATPPAEPAAPISDRFSGRSSLVLYPANGFQETVAARASTAFYRLARRNQLILIAGGEQGELLGYDGAERRGLNFAGSDSAQINAIAALDDAAGTYLLVGNNAPSLARLSFAGTGPRSAETRRVDLGTPTRLGNLRIPRIRSVDAASLQFSVRTSVGSDEAEGWTAWQALTPSGDGGWRTEASPGRYVRLKVELPADSSAQLQIDRATLHHLPQNRRPQLQDFRLLSPNFGLIPRAENPPPATTTLGQLLGVARSDDGAADRRPNPALQSQVVPAPGTQVAYWNVTDPDGDNLAATFSIRPEGSDAWTDLAVNVKDTYAQFEFSHLAEGMYFTRLVAREQGPRPEAERLTVTFETDDLLIDRTAPELLDTTVRRAGGRLEVAVRGRDTLSLLSGVEYVFNHGRTYTLEQPADGILDGREEVFRLEVPEAESAGATSVEVIMYDAAGNASARRLAL